MHSEELPCDGVSWSNLVLKLTAHQRPLSTTLATISGRRSMQDYGIKSLPTGSTRPRSTHPICFLTPPRAVAARFGPLCTQHVRVRQYRNVVPRDCEASHCHNTWSSQLVQSSTIRCFLALKLLLSVSLLPNFQASVKRFHFTYQLYTSQKEKAESGTINVSRFGQSMGLLSMSMTRPSGYALASRLQGSPSSAWTYIVG